MQTPHEQLRSTILNLAMKPTESIAIQRQRMTKITLILTHIASNLNSKNARMK